MRKVLNGPRHAVDQSKTQRKLYKIPYPTDEIHVNQDLESILCKAIESRLQKDLDIPFFLSGGIDSSILVAAASKVSSQKVNTFSIVFKDEVFDERKYSRIIKRI